MYKIQLAQTYIVSALIALLPPLQSTLMTSWRIPFVQVIQEGKSQVWFIVGSSWYADTSPKWMATALQHSSGMAMKDISQKGQTLGPYI